LQQIGFALRKAGARRYLAKLSDLQSAVCLRESRIKTVIDIIIPLGIGQFLYVDAHDNGGGVYQALSTFLLVACVAVAASLLYRRFRRGRFFVELSPTGLTVSWLMPDPVPWTEIVGCRLRQDGFSKAIVLDLRGPRSTRLTWWRHFASQKADAMTTRIKVVGETLGIDTPFLYRAVRDRIEVFGTF
jgi:hypothetical protein